jgi:hypothetical protein
MTKKPGTPRTGRPRAVDLLAKEKAADTNVTTAEEPNEEEIALAAPTADFANGQQLAKAIAQKCDLVAVGSKLLRDGEAKGASVRARMFETTVEYLYGKPAASPAPEAAQVIFVCDIPRPSREKKQSEK